MPTDSLLDLRFDLRDQIKNNTWYTRSRRKRPERQQRFWIETVERWESSLVTEQKGLEQFQRNDNRPMITD